MTRCSVRIEPDTVCIIAKHRMNPLTEFAAGLPYLLRGFNLIRQPQLRPYVLIPLLINIVLLITLLTLFGWQLGTWLDHWLAGLPTWLAWLENVLWWLGLITATLFFCYFFTFLATLVASPFNGMLSARVEYLLTGLTPETGMSFMAEMIDAVTGTARVLGYVLSRSALLALISLVLLFIPLVHVLIPILWFLFGSFTLAFDYLDAPMGNRGLPFPHKLEHLRSRRWRYIGFGSVVTLVTAVPLVNLLIMPAAVAGATALYLDTTGLRAQS